MDQVFHVDCFTCITCNSKLRGQPFYAVEKKAYCEPCYIVSPDLQKCLLWPSANHSRQNVAVVPLFLPRLPNVYV